MPYTIKRAASLVDAALFFVYLLKFF